MATVVLLAGFFAGTVWPTRFRYDHLNLGGTILPVRIDRFSGRTEVLRGFDGWVGVPESGAQAETADPAIEILPPEEKARVTGNAGLSYGTLFQGKLYNGSSYYLREVLLTITAREETGGVRWSRQFRDKVFIETLTTGEFQIKITGAEGAKLAWTLDEVRGTRPR